MDEMPTPPGAAPTRHGMQVAIQDMQEHALVAGKWASLGAVHKANVICVKVSELEPDWWARTTKGWFQGQLVYRSIVCGPCLKGDKTCYGLNGQPCGQCISVCATRRRAGKLP